MTPRSRASAAGAASIELLVIQPTPFCNLDCDYCYLPNRDSRARVTREVLRRTFERVLSSPYARAPLSVIWHAGEPLVLPIAFYEDAFALLSEINTAGLPIRHCFQTNATRVDPDWCAFLDRHQARIGVSVDGPAFLHDARRKTRSGKGTHARVLEGIRCLQEHEIPFYVISVLTEHTLSHVDEMFQFYRENRLRRVCFNIEEIEGINQSTSLSVAGIGDKLRAFMTRLLELRDESEFELDIREIDGFRRFVERRNDFLDAVQENTAMRIVSVDCHGNYSTFSPELLGMKSPRYGDFLFGNVLRNELHEVEHLPKFRLLNDEIEAGIAACRASCEYFGVCGGGSPSNKYFEHGRFDCTETLHCRLTKQVMADVGLEHLEAASSPAARAVPESPTLRQ